MDSKNKSMSIIVTKGTLDWAYPPFILATTGGRPYRSRSPGGRSYTTPLLLSFLAPPGRGRHQCHGGL